MKLAYSDWLSLPDKAGVTHVELTTWPFLEPHAATPAEAIAALEKMWPGVRFTLFELPKMTEAEVYRQLELGYGA